FSSSSVAIDAHTSNSSTLSLHDALPIYVHRFGVRQPGDDLDGYFASARNRELAERMIRAGRIERSAARRLLDGDVQIHVEIWRRSEEHTSELQSRENLVCRLLLEKKKKK